MPDIEDYIQYGKDMVEAARVSDNKHLDDILDGVEGHLNNIERELKKHPEHRYLVIADDRSGFQGLSNVHVVQADSEEEAKEKAEESSVSYGRYKVYQIKDLPEHGEDWQYYR